MSVFFHIIVPVYNAEKYFGRCIESVWNQTYTNYDVILVDDGSTDNSRTMCDDYAKHNANCFVIHQENKGQLAARVAGVRKAKEICKESRCENYIVFLDADDMLDPNALFVAEKRIVDSHTDCIVIKAQSFNDEKEILQWDKEKTPNVLIVKDKCELYKRVFMDTAYNAMWRKIISVELFKDECYEKYYHIRNGEDLIQSINIYKYAKKMVFSDDILYFYRRNPESVTHRPWDFNKQGNFIVRETVIEFLKTENVFEEKDYLEYYTYCRSLLVGKMDMIVRTNYPLSTKISYIRRLVQTDYFNNITLNRKYYGCRKRKETVKLRLLSNSFTRPAIIILLNLSHYLREK